MLSDNTIYQGSVVRFDNYDDTKIIFRIPNLIDEGLAYPMFPEKKPKVGDEVMLFKLSSNLNSFWRYLKIDQTGIFNVQYNGSSIIMKDGKVYIQANNAITLGHSTDGDNVQEGTQSLVYGDKLVSWLKSLIKVLNTGYRVITPQGPSMTATPDAISSLNKLQTELDKIISGYIKSVDDKDKLNI